MQDVLKFPQFFSLTNFLGSYQRKIVKLSMHTYKRTWIIWSGPAFWIDVEPLCDKQTTPLWLFRISSRATANTHKMQFILIDNSRLRTSFHIARKFNPVRYEVSSVTNTWKIRTKTKRYAWVIFMIFTKIIDSTHDTEDSWQDWRWII